MAAREQPPRLTVSARPPTFPYWFERDLEGVHDVGVAVGAVHVPSSLNNLSELARTGWVLNGGVS